MKFARTCNCFDCFVVIAVQRMEMDSVDCCIAVFLLEIAVEMIKMLFCGLI